MVILSEQVVVHSLMGTSVLLFRGGGLIAQAGDGGQRWGHWVAGYGVVFYLIERQHQLLVVRLQGMGDMG